MPKYICVYSPGDAPNFEDLAQILKVIGNVPITFHNTEEEFDCRKEVRGKVVITFHALPGYITREALAVVESDGTRWYYTGTIDVPQDCLNKLSYLESGGFVPSLPYD